MGHWIVQETTVKEGSIPSLEGSNIDLNFVQVPYNIVPFL